MYQIKLNADELRKIKQLRDKEKSIRVQRRLQAIELANKGQSHREIAAIVNVCADTVTNWIKLYEDGGLDEFCKLQFTGKRESKINDYVDQIKQDVKDNTIATLGELQAWINDKYSIEMEQSWLFRCCKKNSIYLTRKLV